MFECTSKLLAYRAHLDSRPPLEVTLQGPSGAQITDPALVAIECNWFFYTLYTASATRSLAETHSFINTLTFLQLSTTQVDILKAPITMEEISKALPFFSSSKEADLDSLPLEFYTHYGVVLISRLLEFLTLTFYHPP